MFEEVLKKSNILGFINEEVSEDEDSYKLVFRVTDTKRWKKILPMLFRQAQDEEEFGLIVNKQFYWDEEEQKVTFCWVLIVWGDLEAVFDILGPVLSKRAGPPPMPKSIPMSAGPGLKNTIIRSRTTGSGGKSRTVVALPHRGGRDRNLKPKGTAKVGTKQRGFAQSIGGDSGDAWDDSHKTGEDL